MNKRVFLIVVDSFGIGALPDAGEYGDDGANTLKSIYGSGKLNTPVMRTLGLFNIDGVDFGRKACIVRGAFGRCAEASRGKDTTTGHFEIAGCIVKDPYPVFPEGFPDAVIKKIEKETGRGVLCNKPYSGTEVIKDYGDEHIKTGKLIVYTSADSVFQIAAHTSVIPVSELYDICRKVRKILTGKYGVSRVIARPFCGDKPFIRTPDRCDFSLPAPKPTVFDVLSGEGVETIGIGKTGDIFSGRGISEIIHSTSNKDGIRSLISVARKNFNGLCFLNLSDFDTLFGHRNNVEGYCRALNYFDKKLGQFMQLLRSNDILIITADHGCDPGFKGTDHTREYVPLMICGDSIRSAAALGTRQSFADTGATVLDYFGIKNTLDGVSFLKQISRDDDNAVRKGQI